MWSYRQDPMHMYFLFQSDSVQPVKFTGTNYPIVFSRSKVASLTYLARKCSHTDDEQTWAVKLSL